MDKKEVIDLLIDIEGEIHFRSPYSSKLSKIRETVLKLKSNRPVQAEALVEFCSLLESELLFVGVDHDSNLLKRIRLLISR